MSFIYTLVPCAADAEDIMQETAKVLWEKFSEFQVGSSFVSWAVTIAKYQVLSYRRKYNTKVQFNSHLIDLLSKEFQAPESSHPERLDALRNCVKKLNQKDQHFIYLRFAKQMTARMLSSQIGVAMNTIYRNESRILKILLNCVKQSLGICEI
jgi:RNA polymerase sigma-70 factor (ECF subfamily)